MKSKTPQYPFNLPLLAALRPHKWLKNLIVFAASIFSFNINTETFIGGLIAFILFSAVSSGFYLINDLVDLKVDRLDPIKCKRPIASGVVSTQTALTSALILITISLILGTWRNFYLGLSIFSYGILQVLYNLKLKQIAILDLVIIAGGFVLRALAGGAAINTSLSPLLVLFTAMLGLFLVTEKRQAELNLQEKAKRTTALKYSLPLLERIENLATTGVIISYALWSTGGYQNNAISWLFITLAFVIYCMYRYHFLSDLNPQQLPEEILLKDRAILLTFIGWLLTVLIIISLKNQGIIY